MLVFMLHYWRPFLALGVTHSAGRRSCQSHYSTIQLLLYISSLNLHSIPSRTSSDSQASSHPRCSARVTPCPCPTAPTWPRRTRNPTTQPASEASYSTSRPASRWRQHSSCSSPRVRPGGESTGREEGRRRAGARTVYSEAGCTNCRGVLSFAAAAATTGTTRTQYPSKATRRHRYTLVTERRRRNSRLGEEACSCEPAGAAGEREERRG